MLTLSGCFFQSVNAQKINSAKELCKDYDSNLYSVHEYFTGRTDVTCIDRNLKKKGYNLGKYLHYKGLEKVAGGEYEEK